MNILQTITYFFHINSGLDFEIAKIAFLFSLIISLFVYHKYHNAPVGIIFPGVILLSIGYPYKLLGMALISILVYFSSLFLHKYIFTNVILAKREKMLILVFLSVLYSFLASLSSHSFNILAYGGIGIVVPAMLADSLTKSFRNESIKSLFLATLYSLIAFVILKLFAINFLSNDYKYYLDTLYLQRYVLNFELDLVIYLLFAIAVIYNFILYRKAKLRSVGLLLGAYLGLIIFEPLQLLFVVIVTTLSFIIMNFVQKHIMAYGFRIFVLSAAIVTVVYSIIERIFFAVSHQSFHPFFGVYIAGNIAGTLICTLLVSEAIQHGYKKTAALSIFMALILAGTLYLTQIITPKIGIKINVVALLKKSEGRFIAKNTYRKKIQIKEQPQKTYVAVARVGDSHTILARRAILAFEKTNKKTLKNYQRLYIEMNLITTNKKKPLRVGDKITFSFQDISNLNKKSKELNASTIKALSKYKVNYSYLASNL